MDMELSRAFSESKRKSVLIGGSLGKNKHSEGWAGILPFWLEKIDENGKKTTARDGYKIVEIPEKADLIREIFRHAAHGLGAKRILQSLKSHGIKCSISLGYLGELLMSRAVLGEHQPYRYLDTGAVVDGDPVLKFPKIVDQAQFDTVAARLDSQKKVCADGKLRPATGNRFSHLANNLFDGLLFDVTDQPERSLHFQKKAENANPYLISKWDVTRPCNRIRYDLFEKTFLGYLTDADWKAIAGERETEALKVARTELDRVKSQLDRDNHLIARRSEQAMNPDLQDAVVAVYNAQIAEASPRVAISKAQENRLEATISLESAKADALYSPEHLIALIRSGDPAMRLAIRAELQRRVSKISLDFKAKPEKVLIKVEFINGVERETSQDYRKPIKFTKPLPSRRARRLGRFRRSLVPPNCDQ